MNLIRAVDLRSNGHHALRLSGRRWRRRRQPAARRMRRRVAGLGQIGCPGLEFERGWHWEHERGAGNRSRVAARAKVGGAELAMAHGGPTATESSPGRNRAGGRDRSGLRDSSHHRETSGRRCRRGAAVERCDGGGGFRARACGGCELGFARAKAVAAGLV